MPTLCQKISNFLEKVKYIDIFGERVQIYFEKKLVHQTKFGAALTIVCAFLSISALFIFGKEVFARVNPTVISTDFLVPSNEMIRFDRGFTFFFGLVDSDFLPLQQDDKIFTFQLKYIDKSNNISKVLPIESCSI